MSIQSTGLSEAERASAGGSKRRILGPKWDGRDTFTVPEAGEICGLSRASAYAAVRNGDLPVIWIGRRCIVPRVALERKLEGA
jgi:hypothetical protein